MNLLLHISSTPIKHPLPHHLRCTEKIMLSVELYLLPGNATPNTNVCLYYGNTSQRTPTLFRRSACVGLCIVVGAPYLHEKARNWVLSLIYLFFMESVGLFCQQIVNRCTLGRIAHDFFIGNAVHCEEW